MIVTILILRVENHPYAIIAAAATTTTTTSKTIRYRKSYDDPPNTNRTNVKNTVVESVVDVKYKRNIFFTVKTTASNYQERLSTLILTWFQTLHKDDVSNHITIPYKMKIWRRIYFGGWADYENPPN